MVNFNIYCRALCWKFPRHFAFSVFHLPIYSFVQSPHLWLPPSVHLSDGYQVILNGALVLGVNTIVFQVQDWHSHTHVYRYSLDGRVVKYYGIQFTTSLSQRSPGAIIIPQTNPVTWFLRRSPGALTPLTNSVTPFNCSLIQI
jgi:hypothetical protein